MTEKNEPETDKLDTSAVDKALKYVAGGFSLPMASHDIEDEDANALRVLAAEVRRLRALPAVQKNPEHGLHYATPTGFKSAWKIDQEVEAFRAEIARLQKVVADQALTIGTLKDELGRLNKENDDWHKASRELREENSALLNRVGAYDFEVTRLQKALAEEKSLAAATAEHTTALERKVAALSAKWTEQRWPTWDEACNILMNVHGPETAVYQAARVLLERVVELENPRPGATP